MSSHPSPGYPKRWKGNIFVRQNKNQFHLFPERRQHKIVLKNLYIKIMQLPFVLYCFRIKIVVQTLKKMTQISETSAFSQPSFFQKLHKLTFMVSHRSIQLLQRKGLYFGALRPISIISQTQAKALTSTRGRAANPQLHKRGGGESRSVSLRRSSIYSFRSREVPAQLPGLCPRRSWSIFSLICHRLRLGQRVAVDGGDTSVFHNFLFFFFYRHRTAFCPTVLFFYLREKRVLVLIT